jgi:hypothetical protein
MTDMSREEITDHMNQKVEDGEAKSYQLMRFNYYYRPVPIDESINEGKKRYYQQDRVGSSKYTISYHDGKQKHKDGSDFFGIQTFKNKKDLAKFVNTLNKSGYVYGFDESVTEDKGEVEKIKKQVGNNEIKFYDALSKVEKRLGSKYPKFLDTALKQLKQNPAKFKTNADKEEAIFQSVK